MWTTENIWLAINSLKANKMRSMLTMLGIIIGIGSVITISTVGNSLSGSITSEIGSFGASNVTLSVTQKNDIYSMDMSTVSEEEISSYYDNYEYKAPAESDLITDDMLAQYREKFSDMLQNISLERTYSDITATNGKYKSSGTLMGVNSGKKDLDRIEMIAGRFITDRDNNAQRAVAVVSDVFVRQYFGKNISYDKVLGKSFEAQADMIPLKLYISGVYKYKSSSGTTVNKNTSTNIYIPILSGNKLLQKSSGYESVVLQPKPKVDNKEFMDKTSAFFQSFYKRNPDFTVSANSIEDMIKSINKITGTIQMGISAVAAISLLVGGIGVMNIMMVSVTERTREIGIRMALGAKGSVILFQFIVEAIIICMIGGIIGVALGVGFGSLGAVLLKYPAKPSVTAAAAAVLFSMGIGVFFGYYPAKRASKLDPIDALRYE